MKIYHSKGTHVSPTKPERLVKAAVNLGTWKPKPRAKECDDKTQYQKQEKKYKEIFMEKLK